MKVQVRDQARQQGRDRLLLLHHREGAEETGGELPQQVEQV